jgi:DNA topoisomerase-1
MPASWYTRHGKGRSFIYRRPDGRVVKDRRQLERIDLLRVPPGWRNVHIALNPRSSVQAWGIDAKGRKQYRYHQRASERGERRKYYRVRRLALTLPAIRRRLVHDFRGRVMTRDRVAAAVVRLIGEGFFRVGSERHLRENGSFGITTLRKSHVAVQGDTLVFSFRGKRAIHQRKVVVDRALARFVSDLTKIPGSRLFRFQDEDGWTDLTARDVNAYVRTVAGAPFTSKDFRTWGGTLRAATVLAELGSPRSPAEAKRNAAMAIRLTAAELGNTPTICRKSYVHPIVLARYLDEGETIALPADRGERRVRVATHEPEERALIRFLDRHFPERRRRPRPEDLHRAEPLNGE